MEDRVELPDDALVVRVCSMLSMYYVYLTLHYIIRY